VTALSCSPCGNFIVGGVDGDVVVWQASTGLQVAVLTGHFQRVTCVAFTDNSSLLASAAADGHVRVHRLGDVVSGRPSKQWIFQVNKMTKFMHF
jgi:WD40 repeat protein